MPTYAAKTLSYTTFQRTGNSNRFTPFQRTNAFVAWIDLVGVRRMNHQQIVTAVRNALDAAAESSANGMLYPQPAGNGIMLGTPQSAIQYSLVGDALVVVDKDQPDTPAAAAMAFLYRISVLSMLLHRFGYLHKGAVTTGDVSCDSIDDIIVITGAGVVKAYGLESGIKTVGLFYDQDVGNLINAPGRSRQIERHSYWQPLNSMPNWNAGTNASGMEGVLISQYGGWDQWKNAVGNGNPAFPSVANAATLIGELKTVHGLP